ncbi:HPr family phosphocarrier protein [Candidatus Fermentibacteria bacterium]|nr:HPr family phosphocarrier protein [Candidatus Fermentibacteria bacterium]
MTRRTVIVPNRLGIHARPAALIVKKASSFRSEITIAAGSEEINGKSIMGVMTLAAGQGTELAVTACGPDEEKAVEALCELIASGFGED